MAGEGGAGGPKEDPKVADTVKDVKTHLHDGGTKDATSQLQKEFTDYAKAHKDSPDDINKYWKGVTDQLSADGTLGKLSLQYAQDNFGQLAANGDKINKDSLDKDPAKFATKYSDNPNAEARWEQNMNNTLASQLKDFQHGEGGVNLGLFRVGGHDENYINKDDINNKLGDYNKGFQQQRDKEGLRDGVSGLASSPDGKDSSAFFKTLADASKSKDGSINPVGVDSYIKACETMGSALADKPDPNNPQSTFNKQYLEQAKKLQSEPGAGMMPGRPSELYFKLANDNGQITGDSLAKGLGYSNADDMHAQNKVKVAEVTPPAGDKTPPTSDKIPPATAPAGDIADPKKNADAIITHVTALSDAAGAKLLVGPDNAEAKDRKITPDSIKAMLDSPDSKLTKDQKTYFSELHDNFAQHFPNQKDGISVQDVFDHSSGKDAVRQAARTDAQNLLDGVSSNVKQADIADASGTISKTALDTQITALKDAHKGDVSGGTAALEQDPQYKALNALSTNFDKVSKDGTTITQQDLKDYAHNFGTDDKNKDTVAWKGFKAADGATPAATDAVDQKAADAFKALPQTTKLGDDGKYMYDLAQKSLTDRAKLTGESVDQKAIMREVGRLVVTNADSIHVPDSVKQSLQAKLDDPNATISSADLPKALNSVKSHQEFKLYSDDEAAKFQKLVADKIRKDSPATAAVDPEDPYTYTGVRPGGPR